MLVPLTGSSVATTVIFLPLAYLSGVTGAFFRPLSLTVALTLGVSYAFALLVVPMVAYALVSDADAARPDVGPRFARLAAAYQRLLARLLREPRWAVFAGAAALALGALAFGRLGTGFLPEIDEGGFVLDYRAPAGTSLSETDRQLREVERILAETPEVATYSRRTGLAARRVPHRGERGRLLRAAPSRGRAAPIDEVIDEVREPHRARGARHSRSSCRSSSKT